MNKAAIEITPSSIKLLILNEEDQCICSDLRVCSYAQSGSLISPPIIQELLDHCSELIEIARLHNIPVWQISGIATGSMRLAFNAKSILKRIAADFNLRVQILAKEEEATFSWFGGVKDIAVRSGPVAMVHVRKEGLYCVLGQDGEISYIQNIGFDLEKELRQYFGPTIDRYNSADNIHIRKEIENKFSILQWPKRPRTLLISGETVFAISALQKGLPNTEYGDLHGVKISRAILRRWQDRLLGSSKQMRQDICSSHPEYAEYLLIVSYILEQLCSSSFRDSALVTEGDTSLGLLLSRGTENL
jgi:exopolyphosphatase/pppGpp-phosphohydrolase